MFTENDLRFLEQFCLNNYSSNEYNFFYSSGRVAEWPIAAVLKTAVGQPTVGSNPTSSDSRTNSNPWSLRQEEQGFECWYVPHSTSDFR